MEPYYRGKRTSAGAFVFVHHGRRGVPLDPRLDLLRLSERGFCWGCRCAGKRQLALALSAHALGADRKALVIWHWLATGPLARFKTDEWRMPCADLRETLEKVYTTLMITHDSPMPCAVHVRTSGFVKMLEEEQQRRQSQ
jgi:hypothetical protein